MSSLAESLEVRTGISIERNIVLKKHTSFRIGGPAKLFVSAVSTETLSRLLEGANALNIERLIIGGGTNLLISDDGFDGLAIKLVLNGTRVDLEKGEIRVQAGVKTADLVTLATENGLGGLAFAGGLPGTIGGGLAGNAGCFGQCLSEPLKSATLVDSNGAITEVGPDWFDFGYRHSKLQHSGHVITEAVFSLEPGSKETLSAEAQRNIDLRRQKHPRKGMCTAGSYFKNLPPKNPGEHRQAAGRFLDEVGAKEMRVGDAAVFEKHANIIVNHGGATAEDVLRLAGAMQQRVLKRFGIALEPEVRFVGRRPEGV